MPLPIDFIDDLAYTNLLNVDLLDTAVEWAVKEEEKRRQGLPSAYLQDRWFTDLSGRPDADDEAMVVFWKEHLNGYCGTAYCIAGYVASLVDPERQEGHVAAVARHALGLTEVEADELFSAENSIEDVQSIASRIKLGRS